MMKEHTKTKRQIVAHDVMKRLQNEYDISFNNADLLSQITVNRIMEDLEQDLKVVEMNIKKQIINLDKAQTISLSQIQFSVNCASEIIRENLTV